MIERTVTDWIEELSDHPVFYHESPRDDQSPSDVVYPFTIVSMQHDNDDPTKTGSYVAQAEFELSCYDLSAERAAVVGRMLKDKINNYRGVIENTHITLARVTDSYDVEESGSNSYARFMTYIVNYIVEV